MARILNATIVMFIITIWHQASWHGPFPACICSSQSRADLKLCGEMGGEKVEQEGGGEDRGDEAGWGRGGGGGSKARRKSTLCRQQRKRRNMYCSLNII